MSATDMEKGNGSGAAALEASAVADRQAFYAQGSLRKIANPTPLALFSFASTTLLLSLFNLQTRHISTPNLVVAMALACGGLTQLLGGMWDFACGNTFGATAFSMYGAFWISYALIFWPSSGIMLAYQNAPDGANQLSSAIGIYLLTWLIISFIFFLATLRTNLALNSLFSLLCITFILLAAGSFTGQVMATKAGGGFGAVTAMIAYYIGASGVINSKDSFINIPLGVHRRLD